MKIFRKIFGLFLSGLIGLIINTNSYAIEFHLVNLSVNSKGNYKLFSCFMENNLKEISKLFKKYFELSSTSKVNVELLNENLVNREVCEEYLREAQLNLRLGKYNYFKAGLNGAFKTIIKLIISQEKIYDELTGSYLLLNSMTCKDAKKINKQIREYTHCLNALAYIINYLKLNEDNLKEFMKIKVYE